MQFDGLDLKEAAIQLLDQTNSNAYRRAFGAGHSAVSFVLTVAPYIAARLTGNAHGWVAIGYDSVFALGTVATIARNGIIGDVFKLVSTRNPNAPAPTPEEIAKQATSPRAINIEFARYIGGRVNAGRPTVGRVFFAGMWNGVKHNGVTYAYKASVAIPATAVAFAGAFAEYIFSVRKAGKLEKQGIDPSEATQKDFSTMMTEHIERAGKVTKKILPSLTQRNRDDAVDAVVKLMHERQLASHRLLPRPN